eukprot:5859429-Prymnesium_polylepis.1
MRSAVGSSSARCAAEPAKRLTSPRSPSSKSGEALCVAIIAEEMSEMRRGGGYEHCPPPVEMHWHPEGAQDFDHVQGARAAEGVGRGGASALARRRGARRLAHTCPEVPRPARSRGGCTCSKQASTGTRPGCLSIETVKQHVKAQIKPLLDAMCSTGTRVRRSSRGAPRCPTTWRTK